MTLFGAINSAQHALTNKTTNPTPGATVTVNVDNGDFHSWTAGENETVNISGTQVVGRVIVMLIANDATSGRTITWGTGLKPATATLVGVISKKSQVIWVSDGTNFYEIARTTGI